MVKKKRNTEYPEVIRYIASLFSDHAYCSGSENPVDLDRFYGEDEEAAFTVAMEAAKEQRLKGGTLNGDDLDVIEVVMEIEGEYNVEIPDEWLGRHGDNPSVGEFADLVFSLLK